jgi:sugar (pentulose or hexulose) kinase
VTARALARIVARDVVVRPGLVAFDGVFAGSGGTGAILGTPGDDAERAALATLYTALVGDVCLDRLAAGGTVVVAGGFTAEPAFAGLLAALRPDLRILVSPSGDGTARGAALLASHANGAPPALDLHPAAPLDVAGLVAYRDRWRDRVG